MTAALRDDGIEDWMLGRAELLCNQARVELMSAGIRQGEERETCIARARVSMTAALNQVDKVLEHAAGAETKTNAGGRDD